MNYRQERDIEAIANLIPLEILKKSSGTYFITGASGFVGQVLIQTILYLNKTIWKECPSKIIAVARDSKKFLNQVGFHDEINIYCHDINEKIDYNKKIDYIIHAAGICDSKKFISEPVDVFITNFIGTANVLELARNNKVKSMVFVSSGYIYGSNNGDILDENSFFYNGVDPTKYDNCYIESKIASETLCNSYFRQYEMPIKVIRPFNIYGPGQDVSHGGILTEALKAGHSGTIYMKSEGNSLRNFVYVFDVVSAIFMTLLKGANGESYNVSGDESIKVKQFIDLISTIYSNNDINIEIDKNIENSKLNSDNMSFSPSNEKLKGIGWEPLNNLNSGLTKTIYFLYGEEVNDNE